MSVADTTPLAKRAHLRGAKPDTGLLSQLADISKNTSSTLVIILVAVIYCYFAIALTDDPALLSNSANISLPIVEQTVPILWFYYVAPLLLVVLFIYFRISMQYYWRCIAKLRSLGTGNAAVEEHMSPSAVSAIFLRHEPETQRRRFRLLAGLESWIIMITALWFLPLVLIFLWARYLVRHDWFGTGLHIILVVVASTIAMNLLSKARQAVARASSTGRKKPPRAPHLWTIVVPAILGLGLTYLSFGAIEGAPSDQCRTDQTGRVDLDPPCGMLYSAMSVLETFRYSPLADFKGRKVSVAPEGWADKDDLADDQFSVVRGAMLTGRDLRHIHGKDAFLANAELERADLRWARLEGADLRSANLISGKLSRAELKESKLQWANLTDAVLTSADLTYARLRGAKLLGADFSEAKMQNASLTETNGGETAFKSANLQQANLEKSWLAKSNFNQATLNKAKMAGGDFSGSSFIAAKLNEANLSGSVLNGAVFYPAPGSKGGYADKVELRDGVLRGATVYDARFSSADLSGADLRRIQGDRAVFFNANLSNATLIEAKLRYGAFARADLTDADLTDAFLVEADFTDAALPSATLDEADLRKANFTGADLTGATLKGAVLREADLSGANLDKVDITGADLLNARGLTQAQLDRACGIAKALPDGLRSAPCAASESP